MNKYTLCGVTGERLSPRFIRFKGNGWDACVQKVSPGDLCPDEEESWAGSLNVGPKHMFESLSSNPADTTRALEEQVEEMAANLASMVQDKRCPLSD